MRIVVLVENIQDDSGVLIHEHGLSLYIEINGTSILFDTGKTDAFIYNSKRIGVNIEDVDIVVLSHGHGDHCGGLPALFKCNNKAIVYMKEEAAEDLFFQFLFIKNKISINKKKFKEHNDRIIYAKNLLEIADNIFIITNFPVKQGKNRFFRKINERYTLDAFDHELVMVIKDEGGLTIFTGCSHSGIVNIIDTVKYSFPSEKIKALIGGFHLMRMPRLDFMGCVSAETVAISDIILKESIGSVYTGHCTGKRAYKKMKSILGSTIGYLAIGTEFHL